MAEYNGWTNYETWCVNLWISNEEGSESMANEIASEAIEAAHDKFDGKGSVEDKKLAAVRSTADSLKEWVEEDAPDINGMYSDLLRASLGEVNWREIAEHYVDDNWDAAMEDLDAEEEDLE